VNRIRASLLRFFTFIGGFYFFLEFILPKEFAGVQFGFYHQEILKGVQVVGVMAIGLGIISIARVHGGNVLRRRPGAVNSAVLLGGFLLMLCFQIGVMRDEIREARLKQSFDAAQQFVPIVVSSKSKEKLAALQAQISAVEQRSAAELGPNAEREGAFLKAKEALAALEPKLGLEEFPEEPAAIQALAALSGQLQQGYGELHAKSFFKQGSRLFENGLFVPLGSAMFALLAFYIATAAYRSFRIRSIESSLLMLTAVIVMLGQIPQGSLYISSDLPVLRLWLLKNISTPAFRAIFFGAAIAGLAMAIRIWLSLERNPLAAEDDK